MLLDPQSFEERGNEAAWLVGDDPQPIAFAVEGLERFRDIGVKPAVLTQAGSVGGHEWLPGLVVNGRVRARHVHGNLAQDAGRG